MSDHYFNLLFNFFVTHLITIITILQISKYVTINIPEKINTTSHLNSIQLLIRYAPKYDTYNNNNCNPQDLTIDQLSI